ncbi:hypothetical protein ACIQWA_40560 [Kitasatospora sp. NPDC098652]|uniref:hypothetical protein n=1 Tax=Kitasatospora sp. NPDC098652 TaxID=3364095 RepID=UPI003821B133
MSNDSTARDAIRAYHRLRLALEAAEAKTRFDAIAEQLGIDPAHLDRDVERIAKEANAAITAAGLTQDELRQIDAAIVQVTQA